MEGVGVPEPGEGVTATERVIVRQVVVKLDGQGVLRGAGQSREKQEASGVVHSRTVG